MCSDSGSDASVSSEASESTAESTTEANDYASELYDGGDTSETGDSSEDLVEGTDKQSENELCENEAEETEAAENEGSQETETAEETTEETEETAEEADSEQIRAEINEKSNYSDEVNEKISSVEELEVYQKANLREETVDGRPCLVRDDIDMDYINPKDGKTNRELMEMGRAPYDAKTGERIELHHIGQDYDSPLAELTEDTEHEDYYSTLHTKEGESWRNDSKKENHYNNTQRPNHWKARAKGG